MTVTSSRGQRVHSLRRPCDTLYPQKSALTTPTSGGRSVGILRSRTQATEFIFFLVFCSFLSLSLYLSPLLFFSVLNS
jgi:hypothetical protein